MNAQTQKIINKISGLEKELESVIREQEKNTAYAIKGKLVLIDKATHRAQARLKVGLFRWLRTSRPQNVLAAPFIYGMVFPLLMLDFSFFLYQAVCFRLFGIPAVKRSDYIIMDRHKLPYLNILERINCDYCSYANGLIAYVREVTARTEQYWCPIKHARMMQDAHSRYRNFIPYGKSEGLHKEMAKLRSGLNEDGRTP